MMYVDKILSTNNIKNYQTYIWWKELPLTMTHWVYLVTLPSTFCKWYSSVAIMRSNESGYCENKAYLKLYTLCVSYETLVSKTE